MPIVRSQPLTKAAVTVRLMTGAFVSRDYRWYLTQEHWSRKRQEAAAFWGEILGGFLCILCRREATSFHHLHYRSLWNEDVRRDLLPVCARCHRRIEGK